MVCFLWHIAITLCVILCMGGSYLIYFIVALRFVVLWLPDKALIEETWLFQVAYDCNIKTGLDL